MMRRFTAIVLAFALVATAAPLRLAAQQVSQQAQQPQTLGSAPVVAATIPFPPNAKKDKGVIEGRAFDALNNPLARDVVRLMTPKGKKISETMSSPQGTFMFMDI